MTVFIDEESEGIVSLPCIFRYLLNNRIDIDFLCLHLTPCRMADKFEIVSLKLHLGIGNQTLHGPEGGTCINVPFQHCERSRVTFGLRFRAPPPLHNGRRLFDRLVHYCKSFQIKVSLATEYEYWHLQLCFAESDILRGAERGR